MQRRSLNPKPWKPVRKDAEITALGVGKHRLDFAIEQEGIGTGLWIETWQTKPSRGAVLHGHFYQRHRGREHTLDDGSTDHSWVWPTFKLSDAYVFAHPQAKRLRDGHDLAKERRTRQEASKVAQVEPKPSVTLAGIADAYRENHAPGWSGSKRKAFEIQLRHILPMLGQHDPASIEIADVERLLKKPHEADVPFWFSVPTQARSVRWLLEQLLTFAYTRLELERRNPAKLESLKTLLPKNRKKPQHHPAVPLGEVPAFMAGLRAIDGINARCLELVMLSVCRNHMAREAVWDHIDFDKLIWTTPGPLMKDPDHGDHRCPIGPAMLAVLQQLPSYERRSGLLFPSIRGVQLASNYLTQIVKELCPTATTHGLRSCFSDWCLRMGIDEEIRELSLAHVVGDASVRAYRRDDILERRRRLLNDWARFCGGDLPLPEPDLT